MGAFTYVRTWKLTCSSDGMRRSAVSAVGLSMRSSRTSYGTMIRGRLAMSDRNSPTWSYWPVTVKRKRCVSNGEPDSFGCGTKLTTFAPRIFARLAMSSSRLGTSSPSGTSWRIRSSVARYSSSRRSSCATAPRCTSRWAAPTLSVVLSSCTLSESRVLRSWEYPGTPPTGVPAHRK